MRRWWMALSRFERFGFVLHVALLVVVLIAFVDITGLVLVVLGCCALSFAWCAIAVVRELAVLVGVNRALARQKRIPQ